MKPTNAIGPYYGSKKRLSLFDNFQNLPIELIGLVIRFGLFSDHLGSHDALHTFQALSSDTLSSPMKDKIDSVFGSLAMQKKIEKEWQLHSNFDKANCYRYPCGETSDDLASWSVSQCFLCCSFLLQHGAVQASTYCRTGQSLFSLAAYGGNLATMELIVSLLNDQTLFEPCDLRAGKGSRQSIFQFSTAREKWFMTVWKRASLLPCISSALLGTESVMNIARFANDELAQELYDRGIDLGGPYERNKFPDWWDGHPLWHVALIRENPVSLLVRLRKVGHRPSKGYLVAVTQSRNIPALAWMLEQSENYEDWREAVSIAAKRAHVPAIFELLLQKIPSGRRGDNTLFNDICIEVINAACKDLQIPRALRQTGVNSLNSSEPFACQWEKDAVLKIKALGKLGRYANVVHLKAQSSDAGLHNLTDALGLLDMESDIA